MPQIKTSLQYSTKSQWAPTKFRVSCPYCQNTIDMITKTFPTQAALPQAKKHRCVKCGESFKVV